MSTGNKFMMLLMAGLLCASSMAEETAHTQHKAKKAALPPPLPSGPRGPVPQVPLDSIPAVAPQVIYQSGQLSILAPNSTLGDILRAVRKQTEADIDIPPNANERVVTNLGPGPAREVVAELLNGSRFNYVLLGSPSDASRLTRVVLVAKTGPDVVGGPAQPQDQQRMMRQAGNPMPGQLPPDAQDAEATDETPTDDAAEQQNAAEAEQQQVPPPEQQPGVKTPQQMLQEMQQRQLQMQQLQQMQQQGPEGQPPPPGAAVPPGRPQEERQQ